MSTTQLPAPGAWTLPMQASSLLGQIAGYLAYRTIDVGLRAGLISQLAEASGSSPDDLADALGMDDFYVGVWCRSAFAAGVLDRVDNGYRLAPFMDALLLDPSSPAYVGGMYPLLQQPEIFDRFAANLRGGERLWWDETSPEWIAGVAATGRPFYTRLIPGGLDRIPGLAGRLQAGCRIVDTACGAGAGLRRLAETYPRCELVGIDGDAHSVEAAESALRSAGVADRARLLVSPLEEMRLDRPATLVINNISMHECRDIDHVVDNVRAMLEPGGWFVISDFPFPDTDEGLRSVPGRIMSGIQFFEAQIDDQLVPRATYDDLLARHGFTDAGWFEISPVHAVTYGRAPA